MARFTSEFKGLLLQDGTTGPRGKTPDPWAKFENGVFETEDESVIERLRKVDYVAEDKTAEVKAEGDKDDTKKD